MLAQFNNDITVELDGSWQYDYGQTLEIQGLILPDIINVQFCHETDLFALSVPATKTENTWSCAIPDQLFQNGKDIIAYVYVDDAVSGNTKATIIIRVQKRERPQDYVLTEHQTDTITNAINLLNSLAQQLETTTGEVTVLLGPEEQAAVELVKNMVGKYTVTLGTTAKDQYQNGQARMVLVNKDHTDDTGFIGLEATTEGSRTGHDDARIVVSTEDTRYYPQGCLMETTLTDGVLQWSYGDVAKNTSLKLILDRFGLKVLNTNIGCGLEPVDLDHLTNKFYVDNLVAPLSQKSYVDSIYNNQIKGSNEGTTAIVNNTIEQPIFDLKIYGNSTDGHSVGYDGTIILVITNEAENQVQRIPIPLTNALRSNATTKDMISKIDGQWILTQNVSNTFETLDNPITRVADAATQALMNSIHSYNGQTKAYIEDSITGAVVSLTCILDINAVLQNVINTP